MVRNPSGPPKSNKEEHRDQTNSADAYRTAQDSESSIYARIEAAKLLTQDQKKQLQAELLKDVSGRLDVTTLDAVNLLEEIGDGSAADRIDAAP